MAGAAETPNVNLVRDDAGDNIQERFAKFLAEFDMRF